MECLSDAEWRTFWRTFSSRMANNVDLISMLKDAQVTSFTILQEADIHRVLWPDANGGWWHYVLPDWRCGLFSQWAPGFRDIASGSVLTYDHVRFRATRIDKEGFYVTFYRL